jgi:hypothetical protein
MPILGFAFLPFVFIILWVACLIKKKRAGLFWALLFFILTMGLGSWAIFQSRSSTAGIGFLFLPIFASFSGFLAWGFALLKTNPKKIVRLIAWLLLVTAIGGNLYIVYSAKQQIDKNRQRDQEQRQRSEAITANAKYIKESLLKHPGKETEWLEEQIKIKGDDSLFLIPALETQYVSVKTLERLAQVEDSGIVLTVGRNKNATSEVLTIIYNKKDYPEYYYRELAAHKNTPPEILKKLHKNPGYMKSLDQWLAENPSTPREVLVEITTSKEVLVLYNLVKNEKVDCELNQLVEAQLKLTDLEDRYNYKAVTQEKIFENKKTKCGKTDGE